MNNQKYQKYMPIINNKWKKMINRMQDQKKT